MARERIVKEAMCGSTVKSASDGGLTVADLGYVLPFTVVAEDTGQTMRYWLVDGQGKKLPILIAEPMLAACLCHAVNGGAGGGGR